jgi:uncharacterized membrane protein
MKKNIFIILFILLSFALGSTSQAQPQEEFLRAKVLNIVEEKQELIEGDYLLTTQLVEAKITKGDKKGKIISFLNEGIKELDRLKKLETGQRIVLLKLSREDGSSDYFLHDYDRSNSLFFIILFFIALVLYFGKKRGLGSILGLIFSISILVFYIAPSIVAGHSPLEVTLIGSLLIASGSLFLAHGFNRQTLLTWFSTILTLSLAILLAFIFTRFAYLFGLGSEDALFLQFGQYAHIDLRGLLLAGIVIGTLGVLDDVTATQTAVIWELKKANPQLKFKELYQKSLKVGREHIASLVNTLALAYAGAALPLFIILYVNKTIPFWLKINSEPIAEEIIRTIVGSSALILAVPISSAIAAYFISKRIIKSL